MGRPHFECARPEYTYENEATGVYFRFMLDEDDQDQQSGDSPISFNINFFRPSYFILEAEAEVTAFVKEFDLTVSDPQADGMGEGEYDSARLIAGWNRGNEFGYQAILSQGSEPQPVLKLPRATLMEAWRWNLGKQARQEALGMDIFVPQIMFMKVNGAVSTVAVWPDAIPIAVPPVGHFLIGRELLAPKRFFVRRKDMVAITWEQALPWFQKYRAKSDEECFRLDYSQTPADLAAFIESLPTVEPELEGVPADQVLDLELVQAALLKPSGRRNEFG